jgi:hypothetical protein
MKNIIKILTTFFVLTFASASWADITDGKFGTGQMFDVQYNWSGSTLNASSFTRIFGSSGQLSTQYYADIDTNNRYFAFFDSVTHLGEYGLAVYNSDGTLYEELHSRGTITALGADAIFYLGSGFYGTVIPTTQGYAFGASASFTAMDTSIDSADLQNYAFATTEPLAAGESAAPIGPIYTSLNSTITNVYATSSNTPIGEEAPNAIDGNTSNKYLNFDKETAGFTVKLSEGKAVKALQFTTANDFELRDPTKFTLYGSNDGITWTIVVENQDITLPSARNTTTDPVTITNSTAYVYYFIVFPELKSSTDPSCVGQNWAEGSNEWQACNSVQIAEVNFLMEDGDTTTSADQGTGSVANPGPQVQVPLTSITSLQQAQVTAAFAITDGNNVDFTIIGSSNTVDIEQLSDGNYLLLYLNGNSNTLDITQSGTNADRNFADINIVGSNNTMTFEQSGASNKTAFLDIDGSYGTYNITQTGTGLHHLDLTNVGNDATVSILQEGTGNHQAIVELENAGGNWNFSLTQSGDTSQLYSVPNNLSDNTVVSGTCTTGTCNLTVTQQ